MFKNYFAILLLANAYINHLIHLIIITICSFCLSPTFLLYKGSSVKSFPGLRTSAQTSLPVGLSVDLCRREPGKLWGVKEGIIHLFLALVLLKCWLLVCYVHHCFPNPSMSLVHCRWSMGLYWLTVGYKIIRLSFCFGFW